MKKEIAFLLLGFLLVGFMSVSADWVSTGVEVFNGGEESVLEDVDVQEESGSFFNVSCLGNFCVFNLIVYILVVLLIFFVLFRFRKINKAKVSKKGKVKKK